MTDLRGLRPHAERVARALAPLGWAFYGHWHATETARILAMVEAGARHSDVDDEIAEVWNTQQTALLRHVATPLGRFGRGIDLEFQRRCQQRQTLVSEAVACHEDGKYAAAMTLALTQVDGITREVVGTTFFRENPSATEADYTDDHTLAGIDGNLPRVRKSFSARVDKVGRYGSVSRHGIIHGMDISFATKVNSTKTLVLIGALVEHLEGRASERARRWRSARDRDKSKLQGVDEVGRLLDDRHLEELYMFRAEFETDVFHALLSAGGPNDISLLHRARTRLEERVLSRRRFTLTHVGRDGVVWIYQSPAGRWLGSAMRIPDRVARPVSEERWTWDSDEEPGSVPWEASAGWTPTSGDPQTPNWRFDGFFNG